MIPTSRAKQSRNVAGQVKKARQAAALDATLARKRAEAVDRQSIGLGNVDNTSDKQKPLSDAAILALMGKLGWVPAPASATSAGTAGSIAYSTTFFYVCVATNTWRRVALTAW